MTQAAMSLGGRVACCNKLAAPSLAARKRGIGVREDPGTELLDPPSRWLLHRCWCLGAPCFGMGGACTLGAGFVEIRECPRSLLDIHKSHLGAARGRALVSQGCQGEQFPPGKSIPGLMSKSGAIRGLEGHNVGSTRGSAAQPAAVLCGQTQPTPKGPGSALWPC